MATYAGKLSIDGTELPIGSTLYGTCTTAAGTEAKVVTMPNFDQLLTGVTIHVKFTYSNTAVNPTLNVNSTGAKNIYRYGTTRPSTDAGYSWNAGAVISFTYDGSAWIMNDWLNDGVLQSAASANNWRKVLLMANTSSTAGAAISSVTDQVYATVGVEVNPSLNQLKANSYNVSAHAVMSYDSTEDAILFTFS